MSAVRFIESRGLQIALADGDRLNVKGLSTLATTERTELLAWIRQNKPALLSELSTTPNPLHHLNRNDIGVDIDPRRGLVLTAGYALSDGLKAHVTLWALGQWDALLVALGWDGPELPRRVVVKSLGCYQLPRRMSA